MDDEGEKENNEEDVDENSFHGRFSLPVGIRSRTPNCQIARLRCWPVVKFLPEKVLLNRCSRTQKETARWRCTSSSAHSWLAARHANHVAAQHPFLWLLVQLYKKGIESVHVSIV